MDVQLPSRKEDARDWDLYWGTTPLPGCNRHHQDDEPFLGSGIPINLHLPQLLGGGDNPRFIPSHVEWWIHPLFFFCFLDGF